MTNCLMYCSKAHRMRKCNNALPGSTQGTKRGVYKFELYNGIPSTKKQLVGYVIQIDFILNS